MSSSAAQLGKMTPCECWLTPGAHSGLLIRVRISLNKFLDIRVEPLQFLQVPFDHPVYILYSSVSARKLLGNPNKS